MTFRYSPLSRFSVVVACVAITATVSGCEGLSAPAQVQAASAGEESAADNVAFWSAPCNLGEEWDEGAEARRATYVDPTLPSDFYLGKYGPTIANEACSDGEILQWQALRREGGERDEICKIAWVVLDVSATVYDLGCTRPTVVIEP